MSILVTGFQPFGGFEVNPSEQIAHFFGGISLPVVRYKSFQVLMEAYQDLQPDAIIMIGLAGCSEMIRLERIAINLDDYQIPDNEGNQPKEERIISNAPDGYFSTLPLKKIYDKLANQQIPVQFSLSAGSYICNHLFFQVMHYLTQNQIRIPAGFIHIPDQMTIDQLQHAFTLVSQSL